MKLSSREQSSRSDGDMWDVLDGAHCEMSHIRELSVRESAMPFSEYRENDENVASPTRVSPTVVSNKSIDVSDGISLRENGNGVVTSPPS